MKSDKTNKSRDAIIMRGVARRSKRRNQKAGRYHPDEEETVKTFHRQRADREAAISNTMAIGDWLRIKKIASYVVKEEGAEFDDDKRNKIEITVCDRILSDSADGKLGTEQSPALMLLSEEYDEAELKPSDLEVLKTRFDRLYGDERRLKIAEFLIAHGWMKRSVATQWLGPQYSLPRPPPGRVLTTAAKETSCRQWLTLIMEEHESRPKTKDEFFQEAKQKYQVGQRAFNRAWDEAIRMTGKANWRAPRAWPTSSTPRSAIARPRYAPTLQVPTRGSNRLQILRG